MKKTIFTVITAMLMLSCGGSGNQDHSEMQETVQNYLDTYNSMYQQLLITASEAEWKLNTYIVEGDTTVQKEAEDAEGAFAKYTGSKENIDKATEYLTHRDELTDLQVKQLESILYNAGANPETAGDVIDKLIAAETKQTQDLFGFNFTIDGDTVSTNQIDDILKNEEDPAKRLAAWESSKEVGKVLKPGLENLRNLRNASVQALGYHDYFNYQVSEYGMTTEEMEEMCHQMVRDIWPLYRELHTWARYTLAEKYQQEVPDLIPAHWLPNRWGQDWTSLVQVEGLDLNAALKDKTAEWIVKQGEAFYVSLGFDSLPASFWEKSSLYPLPEGSGYKKNNHASAWHMDNDQDIRSLMSVEPNAEWWETVLHELGHIYYYRTYSNDAVPIILRGGANRAFHEAMGSMIGLASMQKPFLVGRGLVDADAKVDEMQNLLKEALNYIVFIPWSAGVMTDFEKELYADSIPLDRFNADWWALKEKYQGIAPPENRGEAYCDAASKTHINDDAAQYYDYALSFIQLFQWHVFIADSILHQDPHATNYWGHREVGDFIRKLMKPGATKDWRVLLQETIGSDMSAKPMLDYFAPLMDYLKAQNKGRTYTLPETI